MHHQRLKKDADILIAAVLAMLVHAALFLCQSNFIANYNLSNERDKRICLRIVRSPTSQTKSSCSTPILQKTKASTDKKMSSHIKKTKALHKEQKNELEKKQEKKEKNGTNTSEDNAILENNPALKEYSQQLAHSRNIAKEHGSSIVEAIVQKLQKPSYPYYSRTHGEEGKVLIHVKISKEGRLESYHVIKSSGYSRLDKAAIKAIKKSIFVPAKKFSTLVSSEKSIAFVFRLEDK